MSVREAHIDGVALWAPTLPGWAAARAVFRGEAPPAHPPVPVPAPTQLPPAERRRAPLTVALALAAADEAVRASGHDPSTLLAVFASAHGDLPVIDELCRTLVHTPALVSPTRFLHSIHNAPAGIWSMLSHNRGAHTAISGAAHSFAHGLTEALVQCASEQRPVLWVAYDTAATGALIHTTASRGSLAMALVLSPKAGPATVARLEWRLEPTHATAPAPVTPAARALADNAMAPALPLFEGLALAAPGGGSWPLSDRQALSLRLLP